MPLARIFTRNPERTTDLSSQLRQQGYKVEVVSPDQAHLAPADLEIEFEVCERTDVLARAADLATELEADVAVAPGVLQPRIVEPEVAHAAQIVAHAQAMTGPMAGSADERMAPVTAQSDAEREFEAAFAPVIEMPVVVQAEPAVMDIPVMEQEPLPPVAFLDEPAELEPVKMAEPARAADPMPYLAQLTPFSTPPARNTQQQQSSGAESNDLRNNDLRSNDLRSNDLRKAAPGNSTLGNPGHKVLEGGAKIAARTWADALALTSSTAASVRDHFQEYKKRAQVRSAETRAAHAARLLDLEQRRADAQQRAAELEAAREQAAARLVELVRQRDPGLQGLQETGLQEKSPQEQSWRQSPSENTLSEQSLREARMDARSNLWEPTRVDTRERTGERSREDREHRVAALAASSMATSVDEKQNRAATAPVPINLWRRINPPLRAVLAGAAAVIALFIMGIALGLFHSRAPLASTASHASTSAPAQSGGVTVQTGGVPSGGVTVQTGPARPLPAAGTQSAAKPAPTGAAAQTQANAPTAAKPSPRIQPAQHLVAQQSENAIGDDVVIRHFSRPAPTQKPRQAGQQAGLKHFSDLEN